MGFGVERPVRLLPKVAELRGEGWAKRIVHALVVLLILGTGAAGLALLLTVNPETWKCLNQFPPGYLLLASIFAFVPWGCNALRLMMWLSLLGKKMRFLSAFRIVVATELASAVTPTAVGGGYVKLGLLAKDGMPVGQAGFLMVLGSVIDTLFFLIAIPFVLLLSPSGGFPFLEQAFHRIRGTLWWLVILLPVLGSVAFVLHRRPGWVRRKITCPLLTRWSFLRKSREGIQRFSRDFSEGWLVVLHRGKQRLMLSLLLAVLQWGCRYSIVTLLIMGLNLKVYPLSFFVRQWATFSSMMLVPTAGGSGGAEVIFFSLYAPFVPPYLLGVVTVGWRVFTFYLPVLIAGGLVLALFSKGWMNFNQNLAPS